MIVDPSTWAGTLVVGVVAGVVVTQIATAATTVYLHRTLAHRAMSVHPLVDGAFRVVVWLTTGIRPREWVAVHRKHHSATDRADDPHSPVLLGFWRVQLANAALYRRTARDGQTVARFARDLRPARLDRVVLDRGALGLAIGITILVLTLGWQAGLLAAAVHAGCYLMLNSAINAVGHTFGRRPNPNSATNSQWLAWLTGGEGLHNNHHAAPTSARFSFLRHEVDPGWWLVRLLTAVRLARVRHDDVKLRPVA